MRSLLIAFAILLPVLFIIALSGKIEPAPDIYHGSTDAAKPPAAAVTPGSLEEEKRRLQKRLAELEKMTEAQWQDQKKNRSRFKKKWEKLPPEKKLEAIKKMQEKKRRALDATPGSY